MGGRVPLHPNVRRYLGMSRLCVDRLRTEGIAEEKLHLSWNFVDTCRFLPRPPLPDRPRRALIFSNYARSATHLPAVTEACLRAGLELDVIGSGVGNAVAKPEEVLAQYDIVFAKAKAAIEAMAVGTAVVLCDYAGVGPMVTSAEFEALRPLNFGFEALRSPHEPEHVLQQIDRYDARDAARVRDLLRGQAGLEPAVRDLVRLYGEVIKEQSLAARDEKRMGRWRYRGTLLRYTLMEQLVLAWRAVPLKQKDRITGFPGFRPLKAQLLRLFVRPRFGSPPPQSRGNRIG